MTPYPKPLVRCGYVNQIPALNPEDLVGSALIEVQRQETFRNQIRAVALQAAYRLREGVVGKKQETRAILCCVLSRGPRLRVGLSYPGWIPRRGTRCLG